MSETLPTPGQLNWSGPLNTVLGDLDTRLFAVEGVTVVHATGTADTAAIQAAFNAMKVSGKATGTLVIKGTAALNTPLDLDGGYANTYSNLNGGGTERFTLITNGALVPAANIGTAVKLHGFYNSTIDLKFQGGGASRSVTNAAATASSATITSATASFTSADIGKYIRVEGAGALGHAPYVSRILSITNSTTAVTEGTAVTTVSGAKAWIQDIGVTIYDAMMLDLTLDAVGFAGLVLHQDTLGSQSSRYVAESVYKKIYVRGCGQAINFKDVQGGFGCIQEVWDDNNVQGSVIENAADLTMLHYEGYNPATQTVGLLLNNPNAVSIQALDLGDRPSEAIVKVIGGDGNHFDRLYCTGNTASQDGVKFVEVNSIQVNHIVTSIQAVGLRILGGGVNGIIVGCHYSNTGDNIPVVIDVGPSTSAPIIDLGLMANFTQGQPVTIGSLTGGTVKLHGHCKVNVYLSVSTGSPLIPSTASGATLDLSGYTNDKTFDINALTNHPGRLISGHIGLASVTYGTAAPTTNAWVRGDICWNSSPSASGPPGWMCTSSGTPGTWKAMANLAA